MKVLPDDEKATNVKRDLKDLRLTSLETPVLPLDTPVTVHVRKSWQNHDGPKTGARNRNTGRGIENKLVWSSCRNWSRFSKKERGGGHETSESLGFKMAKLEQKQVDHRCGVNLFFSSVQRCCRLWVRLSWSRISFPMTRTAKDLQWRPSWRECGGGKSHWIARTIVNNEETRYTIFRLGVTCTTVGVESVFQLDVHLLYSESLYFPRILIIGIKLEFGSELIVLGPGHHLIWNKLCRVTFISVINH